MPEEDNKLEVLLLALISVIAIGALGITYMWNPLGLGQSETYSSSIDFPEKVKTQETPIKRISIGQIESELSCSAGDFNASQKPDSLFYRHDRVSSYGDGTLLISNGLDRMKGLIYSVGLCEFKELDVKSVRLNISHYQGGKEIESNHVKCRVHEAFRMHERSLESLGSEVKEKIYDRCVFDD